MKLSSQQINALASKIHKELYKSKDEIVSEIKEQIKSDEQRLILLTDKANDIKWLLSKYKDIGILINGFGSKISNNNDSFDKILNSIIDDEAYKEANEKASTRKMRNVRFEDIRNDIIIETIEECADLEEVINKIKAKYTEE